jgi:hypothetical protein
VARTIIVLTEDALRPSDAAHLVALYPEDARFEVLVPADTERNVVSELVDSLGLLDLRAAWDAVVGRHPDAAQARTEAGKALAASLAELRRAGGEGEGRVVEDDPIPALSRAIGGTGAAEVVVVTRPQMLEDTFHTSWAHRAREEFGIPVLHFYTGTRFVGS